MNRLEHSAGSDTFGSRFKEIVSLATPASVAMLSYTMVGVVDTLLMGRIGASAMAGVGLANTLLFTLSALMMGLIGAVEPLAAQFEGAGRRAEAGRFLHQATWLALIGGLLLGLPLSLGAHTLLSWMNPIDDVVAAGSGYLQVRALGLPLFYLTIVRDHFLQGLGDTRTPMRVSIIINVLHVFLDLWFIFGGLGLPALGPAGAALSTCLSHGMSWVIYRWILRERHRREPAYGLSPLQPPDLERIGQMVKVGWPMSIQFFLDVGSWMLLTVLIGWMGANALAANQITIRIMSVTFMAVHGVSITATSLVGRHLGAGRPDEARRYGWTAVCVGIALMGVIGSTYLLVPGLWIGVFTDDPEVSSIASTLLKMGLEPMESVGQIFDPNRHHGIDMVETDEAEDQTILAEFQKGYFFRGKLLRPSMVRVAVKK